VRLPLPIPRRFEQNHRMEKQTGPIRDFVQWALTPPQAWGVYLICLFLVATSSFYIGTLRPKKPVGLGPPPMAAPSVPRS
jgi:hypothetical protein